MPVKIDRSYHELLRRIGAQSPGEVSVGLPLSLQVIADDLSHLVAPVEVPVLAAGSLITAAVGDFGGVEVQANGWGVIIETVINNASPDLRLGVAAATALDAVRTLRVPGIVLPADGLIAPTSTFYDGRGNAAIGGAGSFRLTQAAEQINPGWYIAPGYIFQAICSAANTETQISVSWREVPHPQQMQE